MNKLTPEQRESVVEILQTMDFTAWVKKMKIANLKKSLEEKLSIRIPPREFKEIRLEVCQWFRKRKHGRTSPEVNGLSDNGWTKLRYAIMKLKPDLRGRKLDEAVAIVSTIVPTNKQQLQGLTSEYHVWGQFKK